MTRPHEPVAIQPRLVVGAVTDPLEREADLVADRVAGLLARATAGVAPAVLAPRTRIQARAAVVDEIGPAGGEVSDEQVSRIRRSTGRGAPLEPSVRASMEQAFGTDFGAVRIRRADAPTRIRRNGGYDDFVKSLNETSDLTSLRVRLAQWDGAVTEQIARHFGIARFKEMVSILGDRALLDVGPARLLQADPTDPFSIVGLPVAQRASLATSWRLPPDRIAVGLVRMLGREVVAPNVVTATATNLGVSFRQLVDGWLTPPPIALAAIKPLLLSVSQADRDLLWQDRALMGVAQRVLPLDDYLGVLPVLRVLTPPTAGPTAGIWGAFGPATLGPMVDTVIRTHLAAYVGGAAGAGRQVEGEMSVVGGLDWDLAFHRQWQRVTLQGCLNSAFAFVDVNQPGRHIWIHNDRGSPGTAIHEGIHKYANPTLRDELINTYRGGGDDVCNLDEGITEYFTRLAIANGGLAYPRGSYVNQLAAVNLLIPRVGVNVIAAAYFDGNFPGLKQAFATATGNRWDDYASALERNDYARANSLV